MGKIQQVLHNLIDNAIKFSNNDSTITVETTEKHGKVFVSVKDTGCGIPRQASRKSGSASTSSTPPAARTAKERDLGFRSSKRSSLRITRISMSSVQRALVPNLSLHSSPRRSYQNKPSAEGLFFARHIKLTLEVIFTMNPNTIDSIIKQLIASHTTISTMESRTSGLIASDHRHRRRLRHFPGGYVTYLNETKVLVGVDPSVIEIHGVYSQNAPEAMARTVQENLHTAIAIGITGTTGNLDPNNADSVQGVVYFCILYNKAQAHTFTFQTNVSGMTRHEIKQLYAEQVFAELK